MLDEAIQFTYKSAQEKELDIQVNKTIDEVFVRANEFLLDVFENILHNALKYNENQTVEIQVDINKIQNDLKNYIKMEFKDNGIGIMEEKKELIFLKEHNKDSNIRGMGIGLSLVKKIIESYNGRIWVESCTEDDYTQGSNFIVQIPEAT